MSLFVERFLRQDGVFLLRLMTHASNALTTVDLTGALWNKYWKSHPPTSDVMLTPGAADTTMLISGRRQADDSAVKSRTPAAPRDDYEPLPKT